MQMRPLTLQPVIETARFDLRPLQASDRAPIEVHAGDARVAMTTTTIPHPLPAGVIAAFMARAMTEPRDEDVWVIDGVKSGGAQVMGVISLTRLDRDQSEIGYWIAPDFWNTHLASDAVQALVAANPLKNDAMFAAVFHDNPASAKVLTKAGFIYLGDAETHCAARGVAVPTWTYSRKL